ncbi:MAG: gliding motility-associated C-terminal domain-containing protein [Sphingobacteriales bacterium JAD_PAG50586_3]|nr:MAG: gliding motility-associated C-terminal domain-containing protein [Sphingobacteriales bacterium JAD_PAG50586_3]
MPTAHGTKSVLGGPTYSIGAAKAVTSITQQPNGSYTISYVVVVRNYGANALSNVQVTDDLDNTFPTPATYTIVTAPAASGSLVANAGFNGSGNINLLTSGTLAAGAQETITFSVNVDTQGSIGTFFNSAVVSATDQNGANAVADSSDWGTNPDPDGDQNPTESGENTPTPTPLSGNTITTVGIAKTITDTSVANCVYSITYQIIVRNLGNEPLENIQAIDNLDLAFPAPLTYTVGAVTATGNLVPAGNFTGSGAFTNLLDAASTLGFGETGVITYTVNVTVNNAPGTYFNSTTATAEGAVSGNSTTDVSDWGTNPDPDLDGFPNEPSQGEDDPTPFTFAGPILGLAKQAGTPQLQGDGSYIINYNIYISNSSGTEDATDVFITDDLAAAFPPPVTFEQVSIPTTTQGTLIPNPNFGDPGQTNVLNQPSTLGAGQDAIIQFVIKVNLNNTTDTIFFNTATVTANGTCTTAADTSNNGTDAQPAGSIPTPVVLVPTTTIIPNGFSPNGDGLNDLFVITNTAGKKVDLQIFNRWGAVIYKNGNYDNTWNGIANTGFGLGEDLPTGTYWYIIKLDDGTEVKEFTDYLTLTR